ncbi:MULTISPECIES: hypothetical protein [Methylobacterium]|nr:MULTISPECIES: hypothetical protein [Methylobacterium]MDR7035554.1 hypothetical protein [Methylobacterium sp. BE186]
MAFFIGIACPWLVLAVLEVMAQRRARELSPFEPTPPSDSSYLTPDVA